MLRFVNVLYETVSQRKCWWPLILLHFANWISLQHNIDLNRILRPQGSEMFLFHAFSNMSTSRTPYDYIIFGKFNLDAKHLKNKKNYLTKTQKQIWQAPHDNIPGGKFNVDDKHAPLGPNFQLRPPRKQTLAQRIRSKRKRGVQVLT